ncbi:terminase small subunit [Methylobacterium sp. D53M]
MALTDKQQRFVEEYLVDLNATQAAIRAGYSEATAYSIGNENLSKPEIAEAIATAQAARSERTKVTADEVLRYWYDLGRAEPNKLVQWRQVNCRHCWGKDHLYQFTAVEFSNAQRELAKEPGGVGKELDPQGGTGFNHKRDPNPDCPECQGEGVGRMHALDTRKLTGPEKLLYRGVKRSKDGFEIQMEDRAKAWDNIAKHLGMFIERKALTDTEGKDVPVTPTVAIFALPDNGRDK